MISLFSQATLHTFSNANIGEQNLDIDSLKYWALFQKCRIVRTYGYTDWAIYSVCLQSRESLSEKTADQKVNVINVLAWYLAWCAYFSDYILTQLTRLPFQML